MSNPIVIDNGSWFSQAGFAGDDDPHSIFPTCVGFEGDDFYVGEQALGRCAPYDWNYPVKDGIVAHWDYMERIWNHTFSEELNVDPSEHPILLAETPLTPKENREKTIEIMFERFNVPSFYLAKEPGLAILASARMTGVIAESGADVSYAVPVYEGVCLSTNLQQMEFGGDHLTDYMGELLRASAGCNFFTTKAERMIARDIKEKFGYVALDFEKEEVGGGAEQEPGIFTLPDGQEIVVKKERFQCPEAFFQPSLLGKNTPSLGFHEAVHNTILQCDKQIQGQMLSNIVMTGGNTLFGGLAGRLEKEVRAFCPPNQRVNVVEDPERRFMVWIGGSILGSIKKFGQLQVMRKEYEEVGASVVHRRCF